MISSTKTLAKVVVTVSCKGNASTHFVNISVTISMYWLPHDEVGRGPMVFHVTSNGRVAVTVPNGALGF